MCMVVMVVAMRGVAICIVPCRGALRPAAGAGLGCGMARPRCVDACVELVDLFAVE